MQNEQTSLSPVDAKLLPSLMAMWLPPVVQRQPSVDPSLPPAAELLPPSVTVLPPVVGLPLLVAEWLPLTAAGWPLTVAGALPPLDEEALSEATEMVI